MEVISRFLNPRSTITLCENAALFMALENTLLTAEQLRSFDHLKIVNFVAESIQESFAADITAREVLERLYSWACHNKSSSYYLEKLEEYSQVEDTGHSNNTYLTQHM